MKWVYTAVVAAVCFGNGMLQYSLGHKKGFKEGLDAGVSVSIDVYKSVPEKPDVEWFPKYDDKQRI